MLYTVRHVTRFAYESPISESVMEVRMQPRTDANQRCIQFSLTTAPASRVLMYQDHDGNIVHHFGIPARHSRLTLTAEALVEVGPPPLIPIDLGDGAWEQLDAITASGEFWEYLNASPYTRPTPLLDAFATEIGLGRQDDPLLLLRRVNAAVYERFEYSPQSTRVDSPIDEALEARKGVCQDFAHIMIALIRPMGIPCRYVSGYLLHNDRADRSVDDATHAWVEAYLPDLGWVGFDPTNNRLAEERHILVAVGRDYADVPPTRGVFSGVSAVRAELAVAVRVGPAHLVSNDALPFIPWMSRDASTPRADTASASQQQ
ncbi:MAG: transglutaminase family protein [Vicinamibacterales bacterium]